VFFAALETALKRHGKVFQPEAGVLPVHAVDLELVRKEFYATNAEGEADPVKRAAADRQAFRRGLREAQKRKLIGARKSPEGQSMLWLPARGGGL
jgi:hypothetical protein